MSDHEVNALRREQRKCEEGAKVTSMTAMGVRIRSLVGKGTNPMTKIMFAT